MEDWMLVWGWMKRLIKRVRGRLEEMVLQYGVWTGLAASR